MIQLTIEKLPDIIQVFNIGISTYVLPAILFVLFQAGYMFYAMNINRVSINSESRIKYDHPSWYYYLNSLMIILIISIDVLMRPELKSSILSWLQIDNERNFKISIYYIIFAFVSHFLIIKPLTRNIIQIDHNLYIESLKLSRKR
ncbi:hypothetical protein ABWV16_25125, partial [Bacillus velezensis]|uniref:hypothetical protein n=1 Tax=Bacillus velezensis TaxID=492670 RepID=UPI00339AFECB